MTEPNVNNASHNALNEYKLDFALKDITLASYFPISTVKEIYREVQDIDKARKVIKVSEEYRINPMTVINVLKRFDS